MGGLLSAFIGGLFLSLPMVVPANHYGRFRFCQLGDIQIGFGQDGWESDMHRMHLAAQQVNAQKFDFCIAVGDLTNGRLRHEISAFQQVYPEFDMPVHLLPGNHDISSLSTLEQFTHDYNVSDHSSFTHKGYRFILLNSITLISDLPEFKNHTAHEWEWFEQQLEDAKHAKEEIIVAHHHPPFEHSENERDSYWNFPKRVRGKYLKLIRKHGVHHILVGHRHETKTISSHNQDFTIYVLAGTARFFDNNGFGINYFNVSSKHSPRHVKHQYALLEGVKHHKRSRGQPTGCPDIFQHPPEATGPPTES
ncbi:Metallo-dependent phosphatase-like protein [Aspergillus avenaceus]|uniref:Metallo-dependent phosphatase-like protein n=1 Tax=Aspergillus avenaceus TaxID=36643 RepID=A0A5N6U1K2_ASPAV|nr:Metallo-dependent phosphatase-like protein [Aspergillus avenaceus]